MRETEKRITNCLKELAQMRKRGDFSVKIVNVNFRIIAFSVLSFPPLHLLLAFETTKLTSGVTLRLAIA